MYAIGAVLMVAVDSRCLEGRVIFFLFFFSSSSSFDKELG